MDVSAKDKINESVDSGKDKPRKTKDKKSEIKKSKIKKSKAKPSSKKAEKEDSIETVVRKKKTDTISSVQDKRQEQKHKDMITVFKYSIPVLVVLFLMMISSAICDSMNAEAYATIAQQTATYNDTLNKITLAENQYKDLTQQEKVQENLHYYTGDTASDDAIADEFFAKYCTWSSGSEYNALRDEALSLGYDDNSSFIKCFFPEQMSVTDADYNTYYAIDTYGVNLTYNGIETTPISYNGSTCMQSYAAIVTVSSDTTDDRGVKTSNVTRCYVTYSITSDGKITNIEAALLVD